MKQLPAGRSRTAEVDGGDVRSFVEIEWYEGLLLLLLFDEKTEVQKKVNARGGDAIWLLHFVRREKKEKRQDRVSADMLSKQQHLAGSGY